MLRLAPRGRSRVGQFPIGCGHRSGATIVGIGVATLRACSAVESHESSTPDPPLDCPASQNLVKQSLACCVLEAHESATAAL